MSGKWRWRLALLGCVLALLAVLVLAVGSDQELVSKWAAKVRVTLGLWLPQDYADSAAEVIAPYADKLDAARWEYYRGTSPEEIELFRGLSRTPGFTVLFYADLENGVRWARDYSWIDTSLRDYLEYNPMKTDALQVAIKAQVPTGRRVPGSKGVEVAVPVFMHHAGSPTDRAMAGILAARFGDDSPPVQTSPPPGRVEYYGEYRDWATGLDTFAQGRYQEAREAFERCLEPFHNLKCRDMLRETVRKLAVDPGVADDAFLPAFNVVKAGERSGPAGPMLALRYWETGILLYHRKKVSEAGQAWLKCLAIDPKDLACEKCLELVGKDVRGAR